MHLQVVSQLPESFGRALRPYEVDGIDTVGAFGNEPYKLVFQNSSRDKVEVIFSIDGRNVLTGREARLTDQQRLVVHGYNSAELAAWPETNRSGPRFVFTGAGQSVAMHTPGDTGALGYLSVAVFEEDQAAALHVRPKLRPHPSPFVTRGGTRSPEVLSGATRSAVGTGAGEQVSQFIGRTTGLFRAKHKQTIQVRYLWWSDLVNLLQERGIPQSPSHPTGFFGPGDQPTPMANLGSTPRPGSTQSTVVAHQPAYTRLI